LFDSTYANRQAPKETGHAAPNQYRYDSAPSYSAAAPQKELSPKTQQQPPQSFRYSFYSPFSKPFYFLLAAQGEILHNFFIATATHFVLGLMSAHRGKPFAGANS
jgi:hypothetical protein